MTPPKIKTLYADEIQQLGKKEVLTVIKWTLSRYVGEAWSGMDGFMLMPTQQLTPTLTEEFLLDALNGYPCFDIDYTPGEGDNLIFEIGWLFNNRGKSLKRKGDSPYSSYIFKGQQWVADCYSAFYEQTAIIHEGVVKTH